MCYSYGYVRVSGTDQNTARQLYELEKLGIENNKIFIDKQSGKNFNRPQYIKMKRCLKKGDILYILSIDRLGRNYNEIRDEWRILTREVGIDIVVLDMPLLDTRKSRDLLGNFISELVLQVLSFVAENERDQIRKRQAQGIAAAKKRGIRFGRPRKILPPNFQDILAQYKSRNISLDNAASQCNMSKSTVYRRYNEYEQRSKYHFNNPL